MTLPESVTSIGDRAFLGCTSLRSINLPAGVTRIGKKAFGACDSLQSIVLPESIQSIGDYAFADCTSLQSIAFPESIQSVGSHAFDNCSSLQCFVLSDIQRSLLTWIQAPRLNIAFLIRRKSSMGFLAYASKTQSKTQKDNLSEYVKPGNWIKYDQEIINNGPEYKYKLPVRLLGALGRLQDPVELTETNRALFAELLNKNARKLVPLAEELSCPDIIRVLFNVGIMDEKTEKAVWKLLAASSVPALSALAPTESKTEEKPKEKKKKAKQKKKETEKKAASPLEQEYAAKLNAIDGENRIKKMKLIGTSFPVIRLKDGTEAPEALFKFLLVSYGAQIEDGDYRFEPEADEAASLLAYDSLCEAMETVSGNLDGPSYPAVIPLLCRYGNPKQIQTLCDQWKNWGDWDRYNRKGRKAQKIFAEAVNMSDTRQAMLFLEKNGGLDRYAELRGVTVQEVYDCFLFDFGFDESGKRVFDLGVTTVEVTLTKDMGLALLNTATGKAIKMIPKKGVDPAVQKKAADELSDMRKSLKKAMKIKNGQLFADYIEGTAVPAARWQKTYLRNPFLRGIASLLVWSQGDATFIVTETGPIDSAEQPYSITDDPIVVAHPMEMKVEVVEAWQKYFTAHGLKQPFSQVWEPVYQKSDIREDRYDQARIRPVYLRNQEKLGIQVFWMDVYYIESGVFIQDFDIRFETAEEEDEHDYGNHLIITTIRPKQWNRRANSVIAYLDRITVRGRIAKDEVSVMDYISSFTLAQITEFIAIAQEAEAVNVLALLLEYKKEHFAGFDPMEEFTLEW